MDERIVKLYEKVINEGISIATRELNYLGFNSRDINELIKDGFIIRIKKGHYTFVADEKLFYYGKSILHKDEKKAYKAFLRCLEINPHSQNAAFYLFFKNTMSKRFEEAFEYLKILVSSNSKYYQADYNIYLYLFNFIMNLPDIYKDQVHLMNEDDLLLSEDDKRYDNIDKVNDIRKAIYNFQWNFAFKKIVELNSLAEFKRRTDILIQRLLFNVQANYIKYLEELWKNKEYTKFIKLLKSGANELASSKLENALIYLASMFVNITNTQTIPLKRDAKEGTVFSFIEANDFETALKAAHKFNLEKNKGFLLYTVLNDLCDLIENVEISEQKKDAEQLLNDLFVALLNGDFQLIDSSLKAYLKAINCEDYFDLIKNQIKLCKLKGDLEYLELLELLSKIKNKTFTFDINYYYDLLQDYINLDKAMEARVILDILIWGNNNVAFLNSQSSKETAVENNQNDDLETKTSLFPQNVDDGPKLLKNKN